MKKRILGSALVLAMILSLNMVVIACPGGGSTDEPGICSCPGAVFVSLPIELPPDWEIDCPPPVDCPEDCQGEDDDEQ